MDIIIEMTGGQKEMRNIQDTNSEQYFISVGAPHTPFDPSAPNLMNFSSLNWLDSSNIGISGRILCPTSRLIMIYPPLDPLSLRRCRGKKTFPSYRYSFAFYFHHLLYISFDLYSSHPFYSDQLLYFISQSLLFSSSLPFHLLPSLRLDINQIFLLYQDSAT